MRHHDKRGTEILPQIEDQPVQSSRRDGIQPSGGFVEQQQRRIERHRSCDAGAPRHAAGNLRRVQRGGVPQTDQS